MTFRRVLSIKIWQTVPFLIIIEYAGGGGAKGYKHSVTFAS